MSSWSKIDSSRRISTRTAYLSIRTEYFKTFAAQLRSQSCIAIILLVSELHMKLRRLTATSTIESPREAYSVLASVVFLHQQSYLHFRTRLRPYCLDAHWQSTQPRTKSKKETRILPPCATPREAEAVNANGRKWSLHDTQCHRQITARMALARRLTRMRAH
jgi:hypothetical protein